MPIYVYRREDDSLFEIKQKITDKPLEVDPASGMFVHRVIQPVEAQYKGAGFYTTDNPRLTK